MSPDFSDLLEKFLHNNISVDELSHLLAAAKEETNQEALKKVLAQKLQQPGLHKMADEKKMQEMFDCMMVKAGAMQSASHYVHPVKTGWFRHAAAIILLIAGAGTYFYSIQQRKTYIANPVPVIMKDVAPGREGAILTLADGGKITLDGLNNGTIAMQSGTRVSLNDGWLDYRVVHTAHGGSTYNRITTPRGRQFHLVLTDGTKIWLNAASSIRFPTWFQGKERRIELSGEAFLEVAKNALKPFKVITHNAEVQVLGTVFNVNAYEDEHTVKATLLKGSIKVVLPQSATGKKEMKEMFLKPGEQASIRGAGDLNIVKDNRIDVDEAVAWKNGVFHMKGAGLPAIMRQIARWYDVEVVFSGAVPSGRITGEVPRTMYLQKVLEVIKASGINVSFSWEGQKLVVSQ